MITVPELAAEALGSFLATDMNRQFGSLACARDRADPVHRPARARNASATATRSTTTSSIRCSSRWSDTTSSGAGSARPTHPERLCPPHRCLPHARHRLRPGHSERRRRRRHTWSTPTGRKARLPRGSSDAALSPYHVDRSKLFVIGPRCGFRRCSTPPGSPARSNSRGFRFRRGHRKRNEEGLTPATADLIGQLGDPPLSAQGPRALLRVRRSRNE